MRAKAGRRGLPIQHGSARWKLRIMRRWGNEIGRGFPKRRPPKGWCEGTLDTLWWIPLYQRYESQPE